MWTQLEWLAQPLLDPESLTCSWVGQELCQLHSHGLKWHTGTQYVTNLAACQGLGEGVQEEGGNSAALAWPGLDNLQLPSSCTPSLLPSCPPSPRHMAGPGQCCTVFPRTTLDHMGVAGTAPARPGCLLETWDRVHRERGWEPWVIWAQLGQCCSLFPPFSLSSFPYPESLAHSQIGQEPCQLYLCGPRWYMGTHCSTGLTVCWGLGVGLQGERGNKG